MSKLMDMKLNLTMCPGTAAYMPPEALVSPPQYSNKLDCFSYGVLVVQVATRRFPQPSNAHIKNRFWIKQIPEKQRRKKDLELVGSDHPLLPLVLHCLKDKDTERPSADELCGRLASLKSQHQKEYHKATIERLQSRSYSFICDVDKFLHPVNTNWQRMDVPSHKNSCIASYQSLMMFITAFRYRCSSVISYIARRAEDKEKSLANKLSAVRALRFALYLVIAIAIVIGWLGFAVAAAVIVVWTVYMQRVMRVEKLKTAEFAAAVANKTMDCHIPELEVRAESLKYSVLSVMADAEMLKVSQYDHSSIECFRRAINKAEDKKNRLLVAKAIIARV